MSRSLKILLFAEGLAGVEALRGLVEAGHDVRGCVTNLLNARWMPSVLDECQAMEIPCATEEGGEEISLSMADRPDVVLSVGYRSKVHLNYISLGTIGAFNVAGSPVAKYRGTNPCGWALLNDLTTWGVSVHQMTQRFCDGALLHDKAVAIKPGDNAYDLTMRTQHAMASAAIEACQKLAQNNFQVRSANLVSSQWISEKSPFEGKLDWDQPANRLANFVRSMDFGRASLNGYEHLSRAATARIGDKVVEIWRASAGGTMSSYPAGTVTRCDEQVWVQTGKGHLVIEKVRYNGRDMTGVDFMKLSDFVAGIRFENDIAWDWGNPFGEITKEYGYAA